MEIDVDDFLHRQDPNAVWPREPEFLKEFLLRFSSILDPGSGGHRSESPGLPHQMLRQGPLGQLQCNLDQGHNRQRVFSLRVSLTRPPVRKSRGGDRPALSLKLRPQPRERAPFQIEGSLKLLRERRSGGSSAMLAPFYGTEGSSSNPFVGTRHALSVRAQPPLPRAPLRDANPCCAFTFHSAR